MNGIPSATGLLLFISCLIASSIAANYTWIVESDIKPEDLPSNLNRETSHKLLLKLISKRNDHVKFDLRTEFYTMATGTDFFRLVADENENKEYHAIAEATLVLLQKLPYMEAVYNNAFKAGLENGVKTVLNEGDITKGLPAMKETIEKSMQDSTALYDEYKRLKNEALAKPLPADYKIYYYEIPKTLDDAKKIVAETLNNPYLKKLMVNSIFVNVAHNMHSRKESLLLCKSILQLAKDPEVSAKVQTLYDEVVAEAANKIEDIDASKVDENHTKETFIQIAKEFFKLLANKFENDPALKSKFAETTAAISKSL